MTKFKKKYIKRDFSKAPLKNLTWSKSGPTTTPDFSFNAVLELINNDPVARGAVNHFVDKCMEGDYAIVRKEDRSYSWKDELRLEQQFMFRTKLLKKIFLMGKLFNNVFIEIVRYSDGQTKYMNILDSSIIEPVLDANGDPESYTTNIPNKLTGEYPVWSKDDIVWIKFGDRTQGHAPVDMRALWDNLLLKHYVTRYVSWLWQTGQYRIVYNFESGSNQDIEDFLTYARKNDDHYQVPFISKGKLQRFILRDMKETSSLIEMLSYLDAQTLILLRVPPIDAGIPDASGRSNADAQANNMETAVVSAKRTVEDYINFELLPKINRSTIMLLFAPMNRFAEKQVFEVAQVLNSMNIKDEVVTEFLKDKGIVFSQKDIFKDPAEGVGFTQATNPRSKDMMPSRQGKSPGEANQTQSETTTREDQLKKV